MIDMIEQAVLDAFHERSREVCYKRLDTTASLENSTDLYDEVKAPDIQYAEGIYIQAIVINSPTDDLIAAAGSTQNFDIVVRFMRRDLDNEGIVLVNGTNTKDVIAYDGTDWSIIKIVNREQYLDAMLVVDLYCTRGRQ